MGTRPTSMRGQPIGEENHLKELEERFNTLVKQARQFYGPDVSKNEVMERDLFKCLNEGNTDGFIELLNGSVQNKQPLSTFVNKSTPSGNSVLHVAAGSGSADIVKLLIQFSDLIGRTNSQEDTALHTSARTGNIKATLVLVKYAQEHPDEDLLKKKNKKGNTALHDAVIKRHQAVAKSLINADPIVAYMANGEVKSPLCLATQNGDRDMLRIILEAVTESKYPISWLEGKSPANAALENQNLDMLKDMASFKPELIRHKDEKEEIPLHFASRLGYFEGVEFLLENHKAGAYERNKKGLYPIHVACRKGHANIVDRLLKVWPDPMELLTRNGQCILHVSAEKGREDMVDHLLRKPEMVKIINEKDEDGNTALHLAAMRGRSMAAFSLIKSKKVDWEIVNNENMAPFQVVEQQIKKLDDDAKDVNNHTKAENESKIKKQNQEGNELEAKKQNQEGQNLGENDHTKEKNESAGKKQDQHTKEGNGSTVKKQNQLQRLNYYEVMMTSAILHFHGSRRKSIKDYIRLPSKPSSKEELKSRIENLLVVAILVASVTFAGAIQIPGGKGHGGGDNDEFGGESRTASKDDALLKVYMYLDVIALNASIMASLILCWAKITNHLVWLASILIGLSIYMMCLAFVFAAAIAVSESVVTFSLLLLVATVLFLLQTLLCVPLIIPPNESKAVEKVLSPYIYYGIFEVYYVFRKLIAKLPNHHHKK